MFLGIWSLSAEFSKAWGAHVQSVLNQGARANAYFQRKKYEGWVNHLTLNIVSVFLLFNVRLLVSNCHSYRLKKKKMVGCCQLACGLPLRKTKQCIETLTC